MSVNAFLLALLPAFSTGGLNQPLPDIFAVRARSAESVSHGTLEYAVILIENGKIVTVGEDLSIERGIPVVEVPDDWIVMPGLVNAYSRLGMDSRGAGDSAPNIMASKELLPRAEQYRDALEEGVTTLALYPAGQGIPGQAVAVRTAGDTRDGMIIEDGVYLKVFLRSNASSKKMLSKGFADVKKYRDKVDKAREKWEKDQEKAKKKKKKKSSSKKKDDEKDEDKKDEKDKKDEDKGSKDAKFTPPAPDPKVKPFIDLLEGDLKALVSISKSADYLHLLDAIGEEEFDWHLRIPVTRELDIFYVLSQEGYGLSVEGIGDRGCFVIMEPTLSVHPGTLRQRNLPNELTRAGAKLILIPRNDSISAHKAWRANAGEMVTTGLDRQAALKAMTLNPAEFLGLGERVGSLDEGKDANLVFLNGDPFEPATEVKAVMLDGKIIFGEVK